MFKFKSEMNLFEFEIIYYFKHLTFLKRGFNWPFSGYRIKNMDPQRPKWSFSRPHNNTVFFISFAICSLILKAHFYILFPLYTFQYPL